MDFFTSPDSQRFKESEEQCSIKIKLLLNFMIGFILSPWSYGLIYYLIFIFVTEIYYYLANKWEPSVRLGMFVTSLLGFALGRLLIGYHYPFDDPRTYR